MPTECGTSVSCLAEVDNVGKFPGFQGPVNNDDKTKFTGTINIFQKQLFNLRPFRSGEHQRTIGKNQIGIGSLKWSSIFFFYAEAVQSPLQILSGVRIYPRLCFVTAATFGAGAGVVGDLRKPQQPT